MKLQSKESRRKNTRLPRLRKICLAASSPAYIKPSQYRVIYSSETFPTAGLGYVYNLKPELAAKIREAFLTFDWKGTVLEDKFSGAKQTKFVPVDYKNDWSLIRRIDDEMGIEQKIESRDHPGRISQFDLNSPFGYRSAPPGEVAERLNAPVSKTGRPARVAGVRISPSPLFEKYRSFQQRAPRRHLPMRWCDAQKMGAR